MTDTPTKQRILIVDDAVINLRILSSLFQSAYEIFIATDGEAALLATAACKPDLILLDIEMPNMDGYEVCRQLKSTHTTQEIPIIFLTAKTEPLEEARGLRLGAVDYISKPFSPEVAFARVENHMALKRHRDDAERMLKALQEAKESAEQANRAKGEFLSNMSHEIRTPMSVIMGLAERALSMEMSPRLHDSLTKITQSSHSLLRIINDILDYSKIEAGKLELEMSDFMLREVFDHLAELFRSSVTEKHLELILCVSEECRYELRGDALRLEQVLMNLLGNAIKFTEEGEIEVQVKTVQESATQVTLEFSVRDTGIGMDLEQAEKIFQPFMQADCSITRKFGGTGLGLSISKKLVESMGGKLWVDSSLGRGSIFRYTAVFQRRIDAETEGLTPPEDMERLNVLIVDDNAASRNALQKILWTFNFAAIGVSSGREAIHAIQQSIVEGNPHQLLLLDWLMPEMNGIQVMRQLHETIPVAFFPKTVLLIPYHREDEFRSFGNTLGVAAYLPKPVNCSLLFDTIMDIFGKKVSKAFRIKKGMVDTKKIMEHIGGAYVLLVEDNLINQQIAKDILEDIGLNVEIAYNGLEAVAKVKESAYDIVLMDIQMPGMDGYEATRLIRICPALERLPIVAMTAHAMLGDREKCLHAGMNDHVTKPIDKVHLYKTLIKWIVPREALGITVAPKRDTGYATSVPLALPGIQVEEGIDRFCGNHAAYRSALFELHREYAQSSQQIRLFLTGKRSTDRRDAANLVHTIRGLAGNLSATRLYNAALVLEQKIDHSKEEAFIALDVYEHALYEILSSIEQLNQQEETAGAGMVAAEPIVPREEGEITALIQILSEQMDRKAYDAIKSCENLCTYLVHAPPDVRTELNQLQSFVRVFDFKGAQRSLARLTQKLHSASD